MNAESFRQLYGYHFAENRRLWALCQTLPLEQFTQPGVYSYGSVRDQVVHLMEVDEAWFISLRGAAFPEPFSAPDTDDRAAIRAHWDAIEQDMRTYLAALTTDMLFDRPITEPEEDRDLVLWQVLLHVVNHGTDHRAQILRQLNDHGVETKSQDFIFYAYDHPPDQHSDDTALGHG